VLAKEHSYKFAKRKSEAKLNSKQQTLKMKMAEIYPKEDGMK